MSRELLTVLCVGGLDPSGGAGLLADSRACAAFGAHALGVATAIVAQNSRGVTHIEAVAPDLVRAQVETLLADIEPAAIKIGMIPGVAVAEVLVDLFRPLKDRAPIVIDPVFGPTRGAQFSDETTIDYIAGQLMPLATVITPNIIEAKQLCDIEATDLESMAHACIALFERLHAQNVLLKGGHMVPDHADASPIAIDLLFNGDRFLELRAIRETDYEVRGTGCLLASAIAAQLADGKTTVEAARGAKVWLTQQIRSAQVLGTGARIAGA